VRQLSFLTLQDALDPRQPAPQLVLWPEAPAPFYYYEDAQFRDQMNTTARLAGVPIIFGGVARTPEGRPLNSAFFLTTDGISPALRQTVPGAVRRIRAAVIRMGQQGLPGGGRLRAGHARGDVHRRRARDRAIHLL